MTDLASLSHDAVRRRLAEQLRAFVGQGRMYSLDTLAAATGIPARTLKSYRDEQSEAPGSNLLKLMAVLPPAFAAALLAPTGLACHPAQSAEAGDFDANAKLSDMLADFGQALRDGRIDHQERAPMLPKARELAAALNTWAKRGDR